MSLLFSTSDNSHDNAIVDFVDQELDCNMESPTPTHPKPTVSLGETWKSPTTVVDFIGTPTLPDVEVDEDGSVSYEDLEDENHSKEEDSSHQSLEELITQSISQIEGVMGEIMKESSSSSNLNAKLKNRRRRSSSRNVTFDEEEEEDILPAPTALQSFSTMASVDPTVNLNSLQAELKNANVMADVERMSNELEETRKSTIELKTKIGKLRGQLAERRALRNRLANVSKIVKENNVNACRMMDLQDKPIMIQGTTKKQEGRPVLSRRRQQQPAPLLAAVDRSSACRYADEMLASFGWASLEDDDSNHKTIVQEHDEGKSKTCSQEQQKQVELGRRMRYEKQDSWGSFVPKTRRLQPLC